MLGAHVELSKPPSDMLRLPQIHITAKEAYNRVIHDWRSLFSFTILSTSLFLSYTITCYRFCFNSGAESKCTAFFGPSGSWVIH